MAPRATTAALHRLAAPLRRLGWSGSGLFAAAGALAALGTLAWIVRLGALRTPLWVIAAWAVAGAALVLAALPARALARRLGDGQLARDLEALPGWRRGAVSAILDGASEGTSPDLFSRADRECAVRLEAEGWAGLTPLRARLARRCAAGLGLAAVGSLALLAAGPARHPVSALWSPAEAWAMFVAPVQLSVDRAQVDRGDTVTMSLRAAGRREAELWTRARGEAWRSAPVTLDSTGRALRSVGPLEGDLYAFLLAGGRTSDTLLVEVRLPAFLGSLVLTARYPRYLGLEDEPLPTSGDTLLLPVGTRIDARGEATAELARAAWRMGADSAPLRVEGSTFAGGFTPRRSGRARLELSTQSGAPLGSDPVDLPIELVPDRPPQVDLPVPEVDTLAVLGTELALVIDVRDDHGVAGVAIQVRRPDRGPAAEGVPLPLPPGTTDRALIAARLDLAPLELEPGDTALVTVVARDNSPAAQVGRSRTLVLFAPTEAAVRAEQHVARESLARRLDSLVADSRQLQRQTEDLSRERQRSAKPGERNDDPLGFDESRRAEQVAREQQDLLDAAEETAERLAELERAAERAGLADSAFQRQLAEIREQLNRALSPELRQRLEELREALKNLDPQATREALKNLAEAQQKLREALERTRELFKRAALEGELTSLEQEAQQLVDEQREWNERVALEDSARAAAQEQALAQRTDSVAQGLDAAAKQLEKDRSEALRQTADQVRQAVEAMRHASRAARSGRSQQARQQGEQAARQLSRAQKEVEQQREGQQQEWRQEVVDALDRALAETARLSQRQLALSTTIGRGATTAAGRAEQAVIEEGVQKLVAQVTAVSGKNALVSPQIGAALVQARLQMARAREAISSASANLREAGEQAGEAVDALTVAAYLLLRSRDDVSGSSSASGLAEAIQRMQQLAGQQGQLSQEGENLLSMLGSPQFQRQMEALAQRQRQLAEELERLRAQSQAPGVGELADEARELARKLEAGRLDREAVERQQRLFRRMLDAGRTLQGEEEDEQKERQSTTATTDSLSVPAPLRRLLDRDGQVRLPGWEELQRLSPEERRLVTEYFRRLTSREGRAP